ncbi:MAG: hypothetical protein ACI3W8_02320 [Oscillospiraceae bacterium]
MRNVPFAPPAQSGRVPKSDELPGHLFKAAGGAQTVEDLIVSHFELDEVS